MLRIFYLSFTCIVLTFSSVRTEAQNNALFPVTVKGKTGYINEQGKVIVNPQYDEGWEFSEGLAPVRIGNKWGYINHRGRIVIKPQFFQAMNFKEGLASVGVFYAGERVIDSRVGYYGYIDKTGKLISKMKLGVAFDFSDGVAQVLTEDSKHCLLSKSGRIVFCQKDPSTEDLFDDSASVKTLGNQPKNGIAYINKSGKLIIGPTLRWGIKYSEGLACVSGVDGAGFIDLNGNHVISPQFEGCGNFSEGLAAVTIGRKIGFIDRTGTIATQPQFDETRPFSDGIASVRIGNMWGYIDRKGTMIIPPQFIETGDFRNGVARVNIDTKIVEDGGVKWAYINQAGKIIWKSER